MFNILATFAIFAVQTNNPNGLSVLYDAIILENPTVIRSPLTRLSETRRELRAAGYNITRRRLTAAADTLAALARERKDFSAVLAKVAQGIGHRSTFHGFVTEFAEARARGLVLTKNPRAKSFDLTEPRFRPNKNYQIKTYANLPAALRDGRRDLGRFRRATLLIPQDTFRADSITVRLTTQNRKLALVDGMRIEALLTRRSSLESLEITKDGLKNLQILNRPPRPTHLLLRTGLALLWAVESIPPAANYLAGKVNASDLMQSLSQGTVRVSGAAAATYLLYVGWSSPPTVVVVAVGIIGYTLVEHSTNFLFPKNDNLTRIAKLPDRPIRAVGQAVNEERVVE